MADLIDKKIFEIDSPIEQYVSPIVVAVMKDIETKCEEGIFRATQNLGVDIDKEELIKALKYDRNQYQKGFNDAKQQLERHAHWCYRSTNRFYECSYCGNITYSSEDKYCSNCGCKMDEVEE